VHHHDILTEALTRFARDYGSRDRDDIVKELRRHSAEAGPLPTRTIASQVPTVQPNPARPSRADGPSSPEDDGSE
jgi:hypothetical protein